MAWHEKIKARREELGLSQAQLAKEIDISQAAINKIEKGLVAKSRFLPRIAKRLSLNLADLDSDYKLVQAEDGPLKAERRQIKLFDGTCVSDKIGNTPILRCSPGIDNEIWLENEPIELVDCPPFLYSNPYAVGFLVETDVMFPEIASGDIVFGTDQWGVMTGTTCVVQSKIYKTPSATLCKIGIITSEGADCWHLKTWGGNGDKEQVEILNISEWYNPHRIVAKYYSEILDPKDPRITQDDCL